MFNTPQSPTNLREDVVAAHLRSRLTGPQVLVVEEDWETLAVLTRTLASNGYRVTGTQVSDHALAVLRCERGVDLLISGPELCAAARAHRPDLACIVVTGADQTARLTGVPEDVPMLAKPLRRQALLDRVASTLRATVRAAEMAQRRAG